MVLRPQLKRFHSVARRKCCIFPSIFFIRVFVPNRGSENCHPRSSTPLEKASIFRRYSAESDRKRGDDTRGNRSTRFVRRHSAVLSNFRRDETRETKMENGRKSWSRSLNCKALPPFLAITKSDQWLPLSLSLNKKRANSFSMRIKDPRRLLFLLLFFFSYLKKTGLGMRKFAVKRR